MVLIKNRSAGSLESALDGPYEFVKYKDKDQYACMLRNDNGKEFDCSVQHLVLVGKPNKIKQMKRRDQGNL